MFASPSASQRNEVPLTALDGKAAPSAEGALPFLSGLEPWGLLELGKGSKELENRINN